MMERIVNRKYLVAAFVLLSVFLMAGMTVAVASPLAPISDGPGSGSGGNGLYMSYTCFYNNKITKEGACYDEASCLHGCGTCGRDDDCYWGEPFV